MARIESQAKAGFYPTPDSVCELLKTKITYEIGARLLDPCCGKGVTLSLLATADTITCGIELSHERATEARTRLNNVLWADALQEVRFSYQTFGLLYLNPPYDQEMNPNGKSQRMETLFLRQFLNALQLDGFLIFVIPYYVLADKGCSQAIARNFKVQVLGFPEDKFQAFKQCIVFGKRRRIAADQAESTEHRLNKLGRWIRKNSVKNRRHWKVWPRSPSMLRHRQSPWLFSAPTGLTRQWAFRLFARREYCKGFSKSWLQERKTSSVLSPCWKMAIWLWFWPAVS